MLNTRLVVSNSTPLIQLAKLGAVEILEELYGEIIIPGKVYEEVVVEGKKLGRDDAYSIDSFVGEWIKVVEVASKEIVAHAEMYKLHEGEFQVIVLALKRKAGIVLIDESRARGVAKKMGLRPVGTVGILLKAFNEKLVSYDAIKSYLMRMHNRPDEFWISPRIIEKALSSLIKIKQ